MSQLLDLAITLTPPPSDAQPDVIASIALNCAELGLNHPGDLLNDPLTQQERDDLRWYLEKYWKWPYEGFAQRAKEVEALLPKLGKRLYESVFGSRQADRIVQKWLSTEGDHQISILSDLPHALSLPWELLHSEQGYMVMRTQEPVSILRRLPQSESTASATPFDPPLRVLLITARPQGTGFIDPRGIARELLDEVQGQIEQGTIELEFLRPPTLKALRQRLRDRQRQVHVLHFDGHGSFDEQTDGQDEHLLEGGGRGKLAFEGDKGQLDLVEAEDVAQVLLNSGVNLVVLTACQSAMSSADDVFSSVAARLIQGGIDAVVAMSASVLVASATLYVEAFYRGIAKGIPAPMAQEQARQDLHDNRERHVIRRRRDEEGQPVLLSDWWLPHFYQQRPVVLRATRPSGQLELQPVSVERLSESMPAEPRYGFSGRAYELLQIERCLLHGQLVVMHGFGGVGKTALVRESADWLTRTRMYDAASFVSFEHGGDAATLLSALGTFLGVYDGHYNPNETKAALAKLAPALKQKHTLVIADNLESILPGGDAPLDMAVRAQVWEVLLKLSQMGAGVLLTTRDTAFGDGSMAPGKAVAHLAVGGLHPEDAYALASRLLEYLGIDRAKAPYAELRELLNQLDDHPLAIQLVLPALGASSLTLAQLTAEFSSLLSRFQDDTETGRNRSLLASLDYSLRRLSQAQRALLPRLALFEGGANEDDLLAITEIPEPEWMHLRPALEQAALLTAEQVEGITAPFLHFHPVLAPYLRSQPDADDPALLARYAQRYYGRANYLYHEDKRHPQEVRALIQKELPNLRRALSLLLEAGELDAASEMAEYIARFLDYFGLLRERDELRRRVGEAVAAKGIQESGGLTRAELLRESGLGDDEYQQGRIGAAYTRFSTLMARIEALPEGAPLGPGSYHHCQTLARLANCLQSGGQPVAAEDSQRKALTVIEALLSQQPENESYLGERGYLLADLADVLTDQGKYSQAREAYEESLQIAKQLGDLRSQGVALGQLGALALRQRDYAETYAAFAGNRYHIEQQFGQLIAAIAAAAQGDAQAREAVEAALPELEEDGWKIAAATRRIWSGERNWEALVEEVDRNSALLILRVLETIAQPVGEAAPPAPEEVFAALPPAISEALLKGDEAVFERALEALSPEEQQTVLAAMQYLQEQAGEESS